MILVDTQVWIHHFRTPNPSLIQHLSAGDLVMHSMVIGELACGNLRDRVATMAMLNAIPKINELTNENVITCIKEDALSGRGIGFVDAHLLCAVRAREGTRLWTRDQRLNGLAGELGVAYVEGGGGDRVGEG